jgi:integrase
MATIDRHVASVSIMNQINGFPKTRQEVIQQAIQAIRNTKKASGECATTTYPVAPSDVRKILGVIPKNMRGYRDKAVISMLAMGMLRSELSALNRSDVTPMNGGDRVKIKVRKAEKIRFLLVDSGEKTSIGTSSTSCPVANILNYYGRQQEDGPFFLGVTRQETLRKGRFGGESICKICKKWAKVAEIPYPVTSRGLRDGFCVAMVKAGLVVDVVRDCDLSTLRTLERYCPDEISRSRKNFSKVLGY